MLEKLHLMVSNIMVNCGIDVVGKNLHVHHHCISLMEGILKMEFCGRMSGLGRNCLTLYIERQLSAAKHVMQAFTPNMKFI